MMSMATRAADDSIASRMSSNRSDKGQSMYSTTRASSGALSPAPVYSTVASIMNITNLPVRPGWRSRRDVRSGASARPQADRRHRARRVGDQQQRLAHQLRLAGADTLLVDGGVPAVPILARVRAERF